MTISEMLQNIEVGVSIDVRKFVDSCVKDKQDQAMKQAGEDFVRLFGRN